MIRASNYLEGTLRLCESSLSLALQATVKLCLQDSKYEDRVQGVLFNITLLSA